MVTFSRDTGLVNRLDRHIFVVQLDCWLKGSGGNTSGYFFVGSTANVFP
jgi:hypothetical protein